MELFTSSDYKELYGIDIDKKTIIEASEMIFAQINPAMRDLEWTPESVPARISQATMEQARFLLEQDIPHVDTNELQAGEMKAKIKSEYSTLALTMLANGGYLYRGSPINYNMGLNLTWGE
jgi:hypothetical protein